MSHAPHFQIIIKLLICFCAEKIDLSVSSLASGSLRDPEKKSGSLLTGILSKY